MIVRTLVQVILARGRQAEVEAGKIAAKRLRGEYDPPVTKFVPNVKLPEESPKFCTLKTILPSIATSACGCPAPSPHR